MKTAPAKICRNVAFKGASAYQIHPQRCIPGELVADKVLGQDNSEVHLWPAIQSFYFGQSG